MLGLALLAASCVIENPVIESGTDAQVDNAQSGETGGGTAGNAPTQGESLEQTEPTAPPSPPTPQPTVPETPTPAPTPEPTAAPTAAPALTVEPGPDTPTPLPTVTDEAEFQPTTVAAGLIAIPVLTTTFRLDDPRPILQLGGHSLIYLDDDITSEVDIFTPVALVDGTPITSYDEVISVLQSSPLLEIAELDPVTIAGHNTRVFEGLGLERTRLFITDLNQLDDENLGWWPPDQVTLWVIDHPQRTVIVTAEAFNQSGRYDDAIDLAADILSTIDFG